MSVWVEYRRAIDLVRSNRYDDALAVLLPALEASPKNILVSACIGHIQFFKGNSGEAEACYRRTKRVLTQLGGVPGDLQEGDLRSLELAATRLRQIDARNLGAILESPEFRQCGEASLSRLGETIHCYGLGTRPPAATEACQPQLLHLARVPESPFPSMDSYRWLDDLRGRHTEIVRELRASNLIETHTEPYVQYRSGTLAAEQWSELNASRNWSALHIYRNGILNSDAASILPSTMQILESLPLMRIDGYAPNVMISILEPGAKIKPHFGSMNGRLIVHLPLIIPPNCGALTVGGESRHWVEGEPILFDDSLLHSAENLSAEKRLVLIFDVWNENLSEIERSAVCSMLKYFRETDEGKARFDA